MYYVLLVVTAVTSGRYSFEGTSEYLRISTCLFRIEVRSRFRSICFRFLEVIYEIYIFPSKWLYLWFRLFMWRRRFLFFKFWWLLLLIKWYAFFYVIADNESEKKKKQKNILVLIGEWTQNRKKWYKSSEIAFWN